MKVFESDKELISKLVQRRQQVLAIPIEKRNKESYGMGIPFRQLFADIEESIDFSLYGGDVFVHVDNDIFIKGRDTVESAYLHANLTTDIEVKVLQRLLLLQRLEEERYIVWTLSEGSVDYPEPDNRLFYLIDERDKSFARERANREAIATEDMVEFVDNGFRTKEDIQFRKSLRNSWIAIGIAFLSTVSSIVFNLCK